MGWIVQMAFDELDSITGASSMAGGLRVSICSLLL